VGIRYIIDINDIKWQEYLPNEINDKNEINRLMKKITMITTAYKNMSENK
jgi:hypothetical protein